MTDKELLELAAKSLNCRACFNAVDACQLWTNEANSKYIRFWNPLTDDGDAFKLAVKIGLMVDASCQPAIILCAGSYEIALQESARIDPYAATRRAIVRAAAEIGKAML